MIWVTPERLVRLFCFASLTAQLPPVTPQEYLRMVDTVHTWDGYMWACGLVVFFTFFFLAGFWYAVRAAKAVVRENRNLSERYISGLERSATLLATFTEKAQELARDHQTILREHQGQQRETNDLIRADTLATNASAKKSEEQTRALEQLKDTVQRLWERGLK